MSFRLTYATMFDPPGEMHERFEQALDRVTAGLGHTHPLFIAGEDRRAFVHAPHLSPIDPSSCSAAFRSRSRSRSNCAHGRACGLSGWRATPMAGGCNAAPRVT